MADIVWFDGKFSDLGLKGLRVECEENWWCDPGSERANNTWDPKRSKGKGFESQEKRREMNLQVRWGGGRGGGGEGERSLLD